MRRFGILCAFLLILIPLIHCVPGIITSTGTEVASVVVTNQTDTLAEAFMLFIQWVNTGDVKVEFDMVVDNDPAVHFELPARASLAILIAPTSEPERDPIGIDADNVVVVRVNTTCPNDVLFENVSFGDAFFGDDIPFSQAATATEGTLGVDAEGVLQPVSFICYSAWQIIVNESSVVVTALDRQAGPSDEAEVNAAEAVTADTSTTSTTTTSTPASSTAPRPLPDLAPRIVDGDPSIPAPAQ